MQWCLLVRAYPVLDVLTPVWFCGSEAWLHVGTTCVSNVKHYQLIPILDKLDQPLRLGPSDGEAQ